MNVTFITGNPGKAKFLSDHLGISINHRKLDLDEIQSLDLKEISEHKARQAYGLLNSPVLVEDVGLVIKELNKLPGPFIKWFEVALGLEEFCQLVSKLDDKSAIASVCFAYFDGNRIEVFEGLLEGKIAEVPRGDHGFGFDPIFIPDTTGGRTLAEIDPSEIDKYALRTTTAYPKIREFLKSLDRN